MTALFMQVKHEFKCWNCKTKFESIGNFPTIIFKKKAYAYVICSSCDKFSKTYDVDKMLKEWKVMG